MSGARSIALDFWRGIAIALVVLVHVTHGLDLVGAIAEFGEFGKYGVQLFFILSGYLMGSIYYDSMCKPDLKSYSNHMTKRFFRVAPMFYLGGLLYTGLYFGLGPRYSAPDGIGAVDIALTAFFVHWITPTSINSVVPGGWSIAAEMSFYLALPLFIAFVRNERVSSAIYIMIFIAISVFCAEVAIKYGLYSEFNSSYPEQWESWIKLSFPSQLPVFAMGILWAHTEKVGLGMSGFRRIVLLVGILCLILSRNGFFYLTHIFPASILCLAASGHYSFLNGKHLFVNMVSRLGVVSFSVYIIHFGVIGLSKKMGVFSFFGWSSQYWQLLIFYVFVLLVSYVLSEITYRAVESRGVAAGRYVWSKIASSFV